MITILVLETNYQLCYLLLELIQLLIVKTSRVEMCVKARFYSKICQLITEIKTSYENNRKAMFTYSKRREHTFIYFTNIQDHKCNVTRSCMRFKG